MRNSAAEIATQAMDLHRNYVLEECALLVEHMPPMLDEVVEGRHMLHPTTFADVAAAIRSRKLNVGSLKD